MGKGIYTSFLALSLLLTGCNNISENDWVQTSQSNEQEQKINSLTTYGNSDSESEEEEIKEVEQVKTEFWPATPTNKMAKDKVVKVLEGDLIQLESGEKFRLLGISTKTNTDYKRIYTEITEEFAVSYLKDTLLNKTVYIEQNASYPRNPQGEDTGYVWIGNSEKLININAKLLESGYAVTERIDNVTLYDKDFKQLENEARSDEIGIWRTEK